MPEEKNTAEILKDRKDRDGLWCRIWQNYHYGNHAFNNNHYFISASRLYYCFFQLTVIYVHKINPGAMIIKYNKIDVKNEQLLDMVGKLESDNKIVHGYYDFQLELYNLRKCADYYKVPIDLPALTIKRQELDHRIKDIIGIIENG